jgi:hypothetical protein
MRTVLRDVLPTASLAVVLLAFMARPWNAGALLDARDGWTPNPWAIDFDWNAASEAKLEELRTLPAYQEAEQALSDLGVARAAVLKAAAASDGDAMLAAGEHYRRTLQCVQTKLAQLRDYLDPSEEEAGFRDLFQQALSGEPGDAAIPEIRWRLLVGVSL